MVDAPPTYLVMLTLNFRRPGYAIFTCIEKNRESALLSEEPTAQKPGRAGNGNGRRPN